MKVRCLYGACMAAVLVAANETRRTLSTSISKGLLGFVHQEGLSPQPNRIQQSDFAAAGKIFQPDRSLDELALFQKHPAVHTREATGFHRGCTPLPFDLDGDVRDR